MPQLNNLSIDAIGDDNDKKLDSIVKHINDSNNRISNEDRTKIIKDASDTPRILFGEGPDQFYGMKVSKENIDVTGAADSELIFNSNQNVFKIALSGTLTISAPSSGAFVQSVSHSLGSPPTLVAYFNLPESPGAYYAVNWFQFITSSNYRNIIAYSQSTSVNFQIELGAGAGASFFGDYQFKYYILQETAN